MAPVFIKFSQHICHDDYTRVVRTSSVTTRAQNVQSLFPGKRLNLYNALDSMQNRPVSSVFALLS